MREYVVMIDGLRHTMLLSDADAKRSGAKPIEKAKPVEKAEKPADKSRTAFNKARD